MAHLGDDPVHFGIAPDDSTCLAGQLSSLIPLDSDWTGCVCPEVVRWTVPLQVRLQLHPWQWRRGVEFLDPGP
ncbi:MAG TPA: hypothetical protein VJY33_04575, partial [Isosphaeraceae bacterium]|nr:hypothetical protein [Isosphaeraceae bacterium]